MDSRVKDRLDAQDKRIAALETKVAGLDPLFTEARGAFERVAEHLDPTPDARTDAAPLDLATLRVPCARQPGDWARIVNDQLQLGPDEDGDPAHWIALSPASARLLALALTQWADKQEGKGS